MAVVSMRGLARRFIPEMLKLGMTQTAGLNLLRSEGMGYRKTDFITDWHEFAGTERKRSKVIAIPKKYRPTEATIQRTDFKQKKKFYYNYKIEGYDIITGEDTETAITVASNDLISMEEAEEEAQRLADKYKVDIEIAKMIITGVTVSKT